MGIYSGDTWVEIGGKRWKQRPWALNPMKLAVARSWLRRQFNLALKAAPTDAQVVGRIELRQAAEPFNGTYGGLGGVNGKLWREYGTMERDR